MDEIVTEKKSNAWLWIVIIVIIAIVVLFFLFKGGEETGGKKDSGKVAGPNGRLPVPDDIEPLDIGENPDVGVDDFSSLEISSEEITG